MLLKCVSLCRSSTIIFFLTPAIAISLSITPSGTNTAGETYSLECSATVTGSTDQPTITWLDPMNNPVPSEMVTTTVSMSTLTFNPVTASHAGTYTCRVTAGGVTETKTSTVIVNGMKDFVVLVIFHRGPLFAFLQLALVKILL